MEALYANKYAVAVRAISTGFSNHGGLPSTLLHTYTNSRAAYWRIRRLRPKVSQDSWCKFQFEIRRACQFQRQEVCA